MAAAAVRLLLLAFGSLASVIAENILCPSTCSCLGSLVDCSKRGLIDVPRDLPSWVERLDLQHNDITSIPEDAFRGLHNLQRLELSHNQLQAIIPGPFLNLSMLQEIKLHHNRLTEIPQLGLLPNLTTLQLHHNDIYVLDGEALSRLPALLHLDLNFNKLVDVPAGVFSNGTRLQRLMLTGNRIVSLEKGALDNLTSLERIKLNKNQIDFIPKDFFRKLGTLKHLDLSRNRLRVLDGLTFKGLDKLQVLRLTNNSISQLMDGVFWGLTSIKQLHLDFNNLTVITKGSIYGLGTLQQLTLSHNQISKIEDEGWEFCKTLYDLNLTYNLLTNIDRGTLSPIPSLRYLHLSHNRISFVDENAFKTLVSLQTFDLSHNAISVSIEDMTGAFTGLEQLNELDLSYNHITSIARKAFFGLNRLRSLDLTNNPVTSIEENAFLILKYLQDIRLNSSQLLCDCSLSWFPKWLSSSHFEFPITATCGYPLWLQGIQIAEANPKNFTCDDFPKPYIIEEPQTQIALKGENVSLICRAASSSPSPDASFQWRKDYKLLLKADIETFVEAPVPNGLVNTNVLGGKGPITKFTSYLHLRNIQDQDKGKYQCVVRNSFGSAYSSRAGITVHVFPVFTKIPMNVTVKVGSTARLECAAKGQPPPVISWKKDGGDDFPAARERRMHVMPSDDVFFIVNVNVSDMGVYSCTALNAAGVVAANATLTVLETPSFSKSMVDKRTFEGETTVLECMVASGSPKPRLNWTKDGGPLVATERHFFTADGQLLIIVQTQASDSGRYACEMSNTLGTERDSSYLTVLPANPTSAASHDSENTTTGIVIIAVVCCVVGTSLVWVIIIYQTRKRAEEYTPTQTEEQNLAGELHSATPGVRRALTPFTYTLDADEEDPRGKDSLYLDSNSEHSSKDSGTGESAKQSSDELLSASDEPPCLPLYMTDGPYGLGLARGSSLGSILGVPCSDISGSISTPSTRTASRNNYTSQSPLLRPFQGHPACSSHSGREMPALGQRPAQQQRIPSSGHPPTPPVLRCFSAEQLTPKRSRRGQSRSRNNCRKEEDDTKSSTFPRSVSSASWLIGSNSQIHKVCPNDSGSFSIVSNDLATPVSLDCLTQCNRLQDCAGVSGSNSPSIV